MPQQRYVTVYITRKLAPYKIFRIIFNNRHTTSFIFKLSAYLESKIYLCIKFIKREHNVQWTNRIKRILQYTRYSLFARNEINATKWTFRKKLTLQRRCLVGGMKIFITEKWENCENENCSNKVTRKYGKQMCCCSQLQNNKKKLNKYFEKKLQITSISRIQLIYTVFMYITQIWEEIYKLNKYYQLVIIWAITN